MKFVIAESGRVGLAGVQEADFRDEALIACVIGVVTGFKFPTPEGGGRVVVSDPLVLGSR